MNLNFLWCKHKQPSLKNNAFYFFWLIREFLLVQIFFWLIQKFFFNWWQGMAKMNLIFLWCKHKQPSLKNNEFYFFGLSGNFCLSKFFLGLSKFFLSNWWWTHFWKTINENISNPQRKLMKFAFWLVQIFWALTQFFLGLSKFCIFFDTILYNFLYIFVYFLLQFCIIF